MSWTNKNNAEDAKKKTKYEGKRVMEEPCTIMSMLNTQILKIKANSRLAAYLTSDGRVFCMGRDHRAKKPNQSKI